MSMPVSVRSLICGAAALVLAACGGGGDGTTPPPTPVLTTINVSVSASSIAVGATTTATASGVDQKGAPIGTGVVSWSTSNSGVASVSSAGVVTGVGVGTASIIATAGSKTGQVTVTVSPPPVASVRITPSTATVTIGATTQLSAATLDASGATLSGRTVTWTTSDGTKATVSQAGVVTGITAGTVTISATSENVIGTASVTVTAPSNGPVATVTVSPPSSSVAIGATQQLSATTLDAAGSVVTGRTIAWSTSDATKATVSNTGLVTGVAAGTVTVSATSEGKTGSAAVTVTTPLPACTSALGIKLALGEARALTAADAAAVCIGGLTSASEYVLMPFNSATSATLTTPFQVEATNTLPVASVPNLGVIDVGRLSLNQAVAPNAYSIEAQFRARESQDSGSLRARPRVSRARLGARAARIPATLPVGTIVQLNTNITGNSCTAPRVVHPARVVASFPHAAVLIDTLSPAGGFTDAELTTFGAMFDTLAYAIDTLNFGKETDIDENGKVVILFTPGINSIPSPPGSFVGGLFAGRDLFSGAVGDGCEGSNEGEMFYMPVPDPQSTINGNYTNKQTLSRVAVGTLAHEFQHLINAGRRVYVNNATLFEQVWLNEALSHIAEELLYFRVAGQSSMTNVDVSAVRTSQATVDAFNAYEVQNFGRYRSYLTAPSNFSPFSLTDGLEMRGAAYTLLRYATDLKGANERTTFLSLVNTTTNGRTNFNAVFGDLTTSVRDWAVANFVDDLNIPLPTKYQHLTWNYRSIFTGLGSATLPIATSALVSGTPLSLQLVGGGVAYVRFRINNNTAAQILASASGQPLPANIDFILVRTQ
jgi:uncharacterized protein YjdB